MSREEILHFLIRKFEGCRLDVYPDPGTGGPPWTVGYGHTGPDVKPGDTWTQEQVDAALEADAAVAQRAALRLCPQADTAGRQAALADFVYNLGATRLAGSTLRRRVREGNWSAARREIKRWVYGGGKILPGLVRRRRAEAALM